MAPKKGKDKKDKGEEEKLFGTLYVKREPEAPEEPPQVAELETAWKQQRGSYVLPLPEWDDEKVDTAEWKPAVTETEELFRATTFSTKCLPKAFTKDIVAWRRALYASEAMGGEEQEPHAEQLPDLEEEPLVPDPKAKAKAKPEPKKAGKGKDEPAAPATQTTAEQFADVELDPALGCVVSLTEFRTRETLLGVDEAGPPLCMAISAQMAVIAEHRKILPRGHFLWELIYPQDAQGFPLFNPHGKYIVKLFVQGKWRQVLIDDVVPVGLAATGSGSTFASMFPAATSSTVIWPMLLAKALITAHQADCLERGFPVITALTGWVPLQLGLSWPLLHASLDHRPFLVLQMNSEVPVAKEEEVKELVSPQKDGKSKNDRKKRKTVEVPALNLAQAPSMPKLGSQSVEGLLQFLVCECVDDPPQVRLKASTWKPAGGQDRRVTIKEIESEADEEEDDDTAIAGRETDAAASDNDEDADEEEEVMEHRSQRSPSCEASSAAAAANAAAEANAMADTSRSQGLGEDGANDGAAADGGGKAAADGAGAAGGDGVGGADELEDGARVTEAPWPKVQPPPLHTKSYVTDHRNDLVGGYWLSEEQLMEASMSYLAYVPPGLRLLSGRLDTTWPREREKPFAPPPLRVLKIKLVSEEIEAEQEEFGHIAEDGTKFEPAPPSHRAVITYEPLRADPNLKDKHDKDNIPSSFSCLLRNVSTWMPDQASAPSVDAWAVPETIGLAVGENAETGWLAGSKSLMLPQGEHWYLVNDDALRAGSVLSVSVEGSRLFMGESSVEFQELTTAFSEMGNPVLTLEPKEYEPQNGYGILAKAEVTLAPEAVSFVSRLLLICEMEDPSLQPHLRVHLLRVATDPSAPATERCSHLDVVKLASLPLLSLTALPLGGEVGTGELRPVPNGWTTTYLVLVESNVPAPVKSGQFALHLTLEPWEAKPAMAAVAAATPAPAADAADAEAEPAPPAPLGLATLKANHLVCWSGVTQANDKGLVLRERLTVPMGAGDVTSTLRVLVDGLPSCVLSATLLAQLPPTQEMRPKLEDGSEAEPYAPGMQIDPKDYGGRLNWLSRCRPLLVETGPGMVVFPHVLLCEGATYRLDVFVDPYRGHSTLESGSWRLEFRGSGEVEVGADTMEQDLENLVYASFEDPNQDPSQPLRKDKAAAARLAWRRKRGLAPEPTEEELAKEAEAAAALQAQQEAAKAAAAKAKKGEAPPPDPTEELAAKAAAEAEKLKVAQERAALAPLDMNKRMADFVFLHTAEPPVLVSQDPWSVAPDSVPEGGFEVVEEPPEETLCTALAALGAEGLESVRLQEVEESEAKWEMIKTQMNTAKDGNAQALVRLAAWREDHAKFDMKCLAERATYVDALKVRTESKEALEKLVAESSDPEALRTALEAAQEASVGCWAAELLQKAKWKLDFLDAVPPLKEELERLAAEGTEAPADAEAAAADPLEGLARVATALREPARAMLKAGMAFPADINFRDLLIQADERLNPAADAAEEAAA